MGAPMNDYQKGWREFNELKRYASNLNVAIGIKDLARDRKRLWVDDPESQRSLMSYASTKIDRGKIWIRGYYCIKVWSKDILKEYDNKWYSYMNQNYFSNDELITKERDAIKYNHVTPEMFKRLIKAYAASRKRKIIIKRDKQTTVQKKGLTTKQSEAVKELNEYTCDSCGVNVNLAIERDNTIDLIKNSLIEVHHKIRNRKRNRNHISNLTTLCITCHGEQEGKGHHFQREDKKSHVILENIRRNQGII